jgi:outer membrane protein TolC
VWLQHNFAWLETCTASVIRLLIATFTVSIAISVPASTARAEPDALDALVATALAENPELEAIEAQIRALEHRAVRASAWKDPRLTLAYQNVPVDSFLLGREPMSMAVIRVEQTIPYFGKTRKRSTVVSKAADSRRWALAELKVQLSALVKRSYYQLALARQLKVLTERHIELVDQLLDTVRAKYEVGKAAQHTVLRLQTLRDRMEDELEDFDLKDQELTALLNQALHRAPETSISTPAAFTLAPPHLAPTELASLAEKHRPALKQLAATAMMHRLSAQLARAEATPDVTVFASYGLRTDLPGDAGGRDLVTVGVSVPLTLFHKTQYRAQSRESYALARAMVFESDALTDAIRSGLTEQVAAWRRAAEKVATYRDELVPGAQRTLDATFSSYQVDRAEFISLFEAEVEFLEFERTIRRSTVAGLIAIANIELLIGTELP